MSRRGVAIVAGIAALAGMANAGTVVASPGQQAANASLKEWCLITTVQSLPQGGLKVAGAVTQAASPVSGLVFQIDSAETNLQFTANSAAVVADGVTVNLAHKPQASGVVGFSNSRVAQGSATEMSAGSGQGGGMMGQGIDSVVPLPTTAGLAGLGLIGLGIRRRRAS